MTVVRPANVALALWLAADALACLRFAAIGHERAEQIVLAAILALLALHSLTRGVPRAVDQGAAAWTLAVLAATLPWSFPLLAAGTEDRPAAMVLRWVGLVGLAWSALTLGRNFSVLPQARVLVSRGPYRFVRHPMYTSYLVMDASFWINDPRAPTIALWLAELAILLARARLEDRCLARLPEHGEYRRRVSSRLLPGLR